MRFTPTMAPCEDRGVPRPGRRRAAWPRPPHRQRGPCPRLPGAERELGLFGTIPVDVDAELAHLGQRPPPPTAAARTRQVSGSACGAAGCAASMPGGRSDSAPSAAIRVNRWDIGTGMLQERKAQNPDRNQHEPWDPVSSKYPHQNSGDSGPSSPRQARPMPNREVRRLCAAG
jgi:hypothetical protein